MYTINIILNEQDNSLADMNSDNQLNIFDVNNPDINSNHFGIYYKHKINKDHNLNQVNLRFGMYNKNYILNNNNLLVP